MIGAVLLIGIVAPALGRGRGDEFVLGGSDSERGVIYISKREIYNQTQHADEYQARRGDELFTEAYKRDDLLPFPLRVKG